MGLRGVGKTVLLDRMRDEAEAEGLHTLRIEAPEGRSLPAVLAPQLHQALLRLSTRNQLISKGMISSPNHGDTAFTVPMFDQFMKRIMPGDDWRAAG